MCSWCDEDGKLKTANPPTITLPADPNIRQLMDRLKSAIGYDSGSLKGDDEMRAVLREVLQYFN